MASVVYAVESWILALLGWAWLSFQNMWAWSLLCSFVFFAFMLLSTCNVIACGLAPDSVGPRAAYFGTVLALALFAVCCVLDTLPLPLVGGKVFESPIKELSCSLPRSTQLFFFSDTQFFLVQASAMLGYLVVQLIVSGAALLDTDQRSLWPGPSWGCGLGILLCCRFISVFDGMAKGITKEAVYLEIFSLPIVEFAFLLYVFMYLLAILAALDGMLFPGLVWRRSLRYVTFTAVSIFAGFLSYVLWSKGMLSLGIVILLVLMIVTAFSGMLEAALIRSQAAPLMQSQAYLRRTVPQPQIFPPQWGVPQQQRSGPGRLRELRHVIPTPVEMLGEKNKGV